MPSSFESMPTTTAQIRTAFLEFFEKHDHKILPSGPLVPRSDPTLMFANAGMVQFKNVFTGQGKRPATRAATVQKCIRISGKHNDLENVGSTSRHHTFFEMLGNFSFGDYFKEEACRFGWDFLTKTLAIDPQRLWVSVFEGDESAPADDDAVEIWRDKIGVAGERILLGSTKDNFWAMGDTGPCGPCSEIMYDRGEAFGEAGLDNGERFFELWNLVFMQYMVTESGASMVPLPAPSIDTGAGLERIASVMQGVDSNYDIDIFVPLVAIAARISGKEYGKKESDDVSMRVVADHARMAAHLISEGVFPEKTAREYVLRRVMRRAIRHGHRLGIEDLFFHEVVHGVVEQMGDAYPELVQHGDLINRICRQEEERFRTTLGRGLDLLRDYSGWNEGDGSQRVLPGDVAFDLTATYGFPLDLLVVIGEEDGFIVDEAGFQEAQKVHRTISGAGKIGEKAVSSVYAELHTSLDETVFLGYTTGQTETQILAIVLDGETVEEAKRGDEAEIVLARTPFYSESGGQIGDAGAISCDGGAMDVTDTQEPIRGLIVHKGTMVKGRIRAGDKVKASVDANRRYAISRHHTATHLLHSALRKLLGSHATQKGSRVAHDGLRFDFTHFEPLTPDQILELERTVSEGIIGNYPVNIEETTLEAARANGVMAIFEENYGDVVRMVEVGSQSAELCGGIHVDRSGDIGPFFILSESGIAAGVRRIEAVAGKPAIEWVAHQRKIMENAASILRGKPEDLVDKVSKLVASEKELAREIEGLKRELASGGSVDIMSGVRDVSGVKVLGTRLSVGDPATLRDLADELKQKMGTGVVCLTGDNNGKASIVVAVTGDLTKKLNAGQLIGTVSAIVGGRGGGRPDLAQAGGPDVEKLDQAAQAIFDAVSQALK